MVYVERRGKVRQKIRKLQELCQEIDFQISHSSGTPGELRTGKMLGKLYGLIAELKTLAVRIKSVVYNSVG